MLSIIITVAGNDIDRYINYLQLLDTLERQARKPDEIIIVEQKYNNDHGYYNIYRDYDLNIKYISVTYYKFSLSWVRNVGIYASNGETCCIMDVDMIVDENYFSELPMVDTYLLGWGRAYFTTIDEKHYFVKNKILNTNKGMWKTSGFVSNTLGGINIFNKLWFIENIGGYCENMFEWGDEDVDVMYRCRNITNTENIYDKDVVHLFHRSKQRFNKNNSEYIWLNNSDYEKACQLIKNASPGSLDRPHPMDRGGIYGC